MNEGKFSQVIGPVVDVRFEDGVLPGWYNAGNSERAGEDGNIETLVCEVALQLGDNAVRSVAMHSTDGLVRGMEAIDTGAPITVPVGEEVLGRIINVCLLYTSDDADDYLRVDLCGARTLQKLKI